MGDAERCLRCATAMEWRHGTWQCPRCRFKLGCCEGETGECAPERRAYESVVSPGAGSAVATSASPSG